MKANNPAHALDPDLEFNGIGQVELPEHHAATAVTIRNDRIALAGTSPDGVFGMVMTPQGAPVPDWGVGGRVEFAFSYGLNEESRGGKLIELPSGRYLFSGAVDVDQKRYPAFAAFTTQGYPDCTFGPEGIVVVRDWVLAVPADAATAAYPQQGVSAAVLEDESILFAVMSGIAKLTPNGALDLSFGSGGGRALLEFPDARATFTPRDVWVRSNGSIVVDGDLAYPAASLAAAVCLTADGHIDPGFGDAGWFVASKLPQGHRIGSVEMPDDECVLITSLIGPKQIGILAGVDAQGGYSPRFNDGDPLEVRGGERCLLYSGQSDAQGALVLWGLFGETRQDMQALLVGVDRDGHLDQRFGPEGWVHGLPGFHVVGAVVQNDGRILIACRDFNHLVGKSLLMRVKGLSRLPGVATVSSYSCA
ncbi:hypothetical protein [Pseudomonas putida]